MAAIIISPIPTKDNTGDFLSSGVLTAEYPMMETHEHAKLYGLFKGLRVRETLLSRSINGTFERSTVYPIPSGYNSLVCIGCDDAWEGDELPSVVAVIRSMAVDNKKIIIIKDFSKINGANELHEALSAELDVECLEIGELKAKMHEKEL